MENISTTQTASESQDQRNIKYFSSFLFIPLKGGIFGFTAFFGLLSGIKYLSFLAGSQARFSLDISDVMLALLGFVLVFLIKFLKNFEEKEPDISEKS